MSISPASLVGVPDLAWNSSTFVTSENVTMSNFHLARLRIMFSSLRADAGSEGFNLMGSVWLRPSRTMKVKTESNVRREPLQIPDPPCLICKGRGRVRCFRCCGRGRLNFKEQVMLPKGEWPQWCWDCRGCGMSYCTRCLGTGEKRGIIGFHFPDDPTPNSSSDGIQN